MVLEANNGLAPVTPEVEARFTALNEATNAGDQRAPRELLVLCEQYPILWRGLGDLQVQAERSWLEAMIPGDSPRDSFHRRMLKEGAEQRRRELSRAGNSPLERLLIDRIISAWLQVTFAEMKYTQALGNLTCPYERAEFNQKRVDRAQRQLLRATQALATVRRLVAPTQLNVGMNQVNIADGAQVIAHHQGEHHRGANDVQ